MSLSTTSPIHRDGAYFYSKLSVPADCAGRLIGEGGSNLRAIRESTGATVQVERRGASRTRQVAVRGRSAEAVLAANVAVSNSLRRDRDPLGFLDRKAAKKTAHPAATAARARQKAAASAAKAAKEAKAGGNHYLPATWS